ncbi:MAG: hypothetical protein ACK5Z6_13540 [Hyphomonadaceae bacterium]
MWPDGQANDPDLRYSFASFAAEAGASLQLIGKALGHTQIKTTERNAHLRDDPLQAMVDLVGERFENIVKKNVLGQIVQSLRNFMSI